jgi:hypothetical protein
MLRISRGHGPDGPSARPACVLSLLVAHCSGGLPVSARQSRAFFARQIRITALPPLA